MVVPIIHIYIDCNFLFLILEIPDGNQEIDGFIFEGVNSIK